MKSNALLLLIAILLIGCTGIPSGLNAVGNFDAQRYTGKWYEIARLPNSFEEGLEQISAEYALTEDGGLSVTNSGLNSSTGKREYAYGKAHFIGSPSTGSLKVSFFGPFYGGYHIIELDPDYRYSLVVGPDRDFLWILSRTKTLPESVTQRLVNKAKRLGFDTGKLIYPAQ